MSQLQSQLKRLKSEIVSIDHKNYKSLLYNEKEAHKVSLEQAQDACYKSFESLSETDSNFEEFEFLVNKTSLELNRTLLVIKLTKTRAEDEELNEKLDSFFVLLSNYFCLMDAFKIAEYLVRRYRFTILFRTNKFNIKSMIKFGILYHDTDQFRKLLSIIDKYFNVE